MATMMFTPQMAQESPLTVGQLMEMLSQLDPSTPVWVPCDCGETTCDWVEQCDDHVLLACS